MRKIFAVVFAVLMALPMAALAQEIGISKNVASHMMIAPQVTQEKAEGIVKSWGVVVTSSELNYNGDFATWDVYGYYVTTLGSSKIKLNVVIRLDATNGELVSLEAKKQGSYDKNIVYEKMKELGVTVQSVNLVKETNPYWEVYGTKYIDLSGFGFDMSLYIRIDARTGNILEVSQQPIYHTMGRTEPVTRDVPIFTNFSDRTSPLMPFEYPIGVKRTIVEDKFPIREDRVDNFSIDESVIVVE